MEHRWRASRLRALNRLLEYALAESKDLGLAHLDQLLGAAALAVSDECARILVLEDDEAVGRVIFRRLDAAGHRVRAFAQAGPALDEIDGGAPFDLYLLDVTMPAAGELHGLTLARMIKTRFREARIILCDRRSASCLPA